MDEAATIERADLLWREGRRAAALDLLRVQVRTSPADARARLALIAKYRELGAPDQAGRWGLALAGETSDVERDRAARLVAGAGVHARDLHDFLALPSRDLPLEVLELLPLIEHYRGRFDHKHPDREPPPTSRLEAVAFELWLTVIGLAIVSLVVVWGGAVLGARMTAFARWSGVAGVGIAALGGMAEGWWCLRSGSRARGWAWVLSAAVVAAGLGLLVTAAVQPGGEILFSWEK